MMEFHPFGLAVHEQYTRIAKNELYVVDAQNIFDYYLAAFPPGSNPIYKTRTEHDCQCCKQFVRTLGKVVSIENGKLLTVWPTANLEEPYLTVSKAMDKYIRSLPIVSIFRTKEPNYGTATSRQLLEDGKVITWNHFHGKVATRHLSHKPDEDKGFFNTNVQVFRRGLEELTPDALEQVVSLIESKAIYRGEEHLSAVMGFQLLQDQYLELKTKAEKNRFVFSKANDPATRFRNTVIGTLVQDLSADEELEKAVKAFETKVAPTNYKRTTALITPRMVQDAMKTIRELNLEDALDRRLAKISDISVNNVLWVDRNVKGKMKAGVEELLMAYAKGGPAISDAKQQDVNIAYFLQNVLPRAEGIELFLRNTHTNNFMTLTAPVHGSSGRLFKWNNDFAWSYDGNLTDTIREKVKAAGGNVDAKLRFSLAWYNYDDLDIHVKTPDKNHIYFGNKAGILDVDMNAGWGQSRQPVENLSFKKPVDGVYEVWVNQFNRRETTDIGFTIEIVSGDLVRQLSCKRGLLPNENVPVVKATVRNGLIVEFQFGKDMVGEGIPQDKWGLKTEKMHKVQTILLSPNHWDDNKVGNRHVFFILDGCKVDGPARGIYNEFLAGPLEKHRKVFEVLGDKTKCLPATEQLSGVGFSTTRDDKVTVAVKTNGREQLFNVVF